MTEPLSTADLFNRAIDARLSNLHVAMPGRVESYNSDRDAVDVQPLLQRHVPSGDPEDVAPTLETLPIIRAVPLVRPRGAGFFIGMPIAVGDYVLLVFAERDIGTWRENGSISDPGDQRTHGLQAAMAVPGIFPVADKPVSINNSAIEIGMVDGSFRVTVTDSALEVGGGADAAALASATETELNDLKTAISGWLVAPNDGGAALKLALATWYSTSASVASTQLKVDS